MKKFNIHSRKSHSMDPLKEAIRMKIPEEVAKITEFRERHNNDKVCEVTVDQIYSGMRGILALTYETSLLDPNEGIRYRGKTIDEIRSILPKLGGSEEPLPEGLFWFLVTGNIPTEENVRWVSKEWAKRSLVPAHIFRIINSFDPSVHPMVQMSAAVASLSSTSKFSKAYDENTMKKSEYWQYTYEDCMDLIAKLPTIAAKIYRNLYHDGIIMEYEKNCDWAWNYVNMLGLKKEEDFCNLMRLYFITHADHEGGNVSAHTNRLVSSALSDPFVSFSAALSGLAGPLHGRANQEVVMWLEELVNKVGISPSNEELNHYCTEVIKKSVIPGYGHAVLRKTDPRFSVISEFASKHLPEDLKYKLVLRLYSIVPEILKNLGKVKNPWPNVDAISGVVLSHYNLIEKEYFTVPFGISRSIGCSASLIWDRILNLPLERPKSITTNALIQLFKK